MMRVFFIFSFVFFSCNVNHTQVNNDIDVVKIESIPKNHYNASGDSIFLSSVNIDSITSGDYLRKTFIRYYSGLKGTDFIKIKLIDSFPIYQFGNTLVYKLVFSDQLPESVQKVNYLIVNSVSLLGTILLVDSIMPIRISDKYNDVLLGGVQIHKGVGYLIIYDFVEKNELKEIFNSMNLSNRGIPIYNASDDCISYKPNWLSFKNIDKNSDGILDANFSGFVAYYCKGLELGYSQYDRLPLKIKKINFSILLERTKNNHFKAVFHSKDSVYSLIYGDN